MNLATLMQQAKQDDELMQTMYQALGNGFSQTVPLNNSPTANNSDELFEQRLQHQVAQTTSILNGLNQVQAEFSQQRQAIVQNPKAQYGTDDIIEGEFR